jgi:hypothetical protein
VCKEAVEVAAACTDREPSRIKGEIEMSIPIVKGIGISHEKAHRSLKAQIVASRMHNIIKEHSLIVIKIRRIQKKYQGPGPGFEPGS